MRDPTDVSAGGDLVRAGSALTRETLNTLRSSDGTIHLFVEAVAPTMDALNGAITASFSFASSEGDCPSPRTDSVRVAAVELETVDARAWGPLWSVENGPSLENLDLDAAVDAAAQVGGAITDGASLCLFRVRLWLPEIAQTWPNLQVSIVRADNPAVVAPKVVGTFHATASAGQIVLPAIPVPFDDVQSDEPSTGPFGDGKAFYLPPETYADPSYIAWSQTLNPLEQCQMRIEVRDNASLVASRPFVLRRPPVVLVHGIMSSPSTWDPNEWNEAGGLPVPTRIYYADWSATGTSQTGVTGSRPASPIDRWEAKRSSRSRRRRIHPAIGRYVGSRVSGLPASRSAMRPFRELCGN